MIKKTIKSFIYNQSLVHDCVKVFIATKFHPKVLRPQCKVNVKWVGTEFHHFASFVRNLALNNMQISYLLHNSA